MNLPELDYSAFAQGIKQDKQLELYFLGFQAERVNALKKKLPVVENVGYFLQLKKQRPHEIRETSRYLEFILLKTRSLRRFPPFVGTIPLEWMRYIRKAVSMWRKILLSRMKAY